MTSSLTSKDALDAQCIGLTITPESKKQMSLRMKPNQRKHMKIVVVFNTLKHFKFTAKENVFTYQTKRVFFPNDYKQLMWYIAIN